MRSKYAYGWRQSKPDFRDEFHRHKTKGLPESELPKLKDLRDKFPGVYDQGDLGSCTANSIASIIEYLCIIGNYQWPFTPSRLFIYYNERLIEGTVDYDAGAMIRDGIKAVNQWGVCPEADPTGKNPGWWLTYDDGPRKFKEPPSLKCYKDAVLHRALDYQAISLNRNDVLNALAADNPITFGFTVYESFESDEVAESGVMPIPGRRESALGGHCITAVGYMLDNPMGNQGIKDWAIVRNSWGPKWGMGGHFLMPLDAVMCHSGFSSDAWIIKSVGFQDARTTQ